MPVLTLKHSSHEQVHTQSFAQMSIEKKIKTHGLSASIPPTIYVFHKGLN